MNKHWKLDTHGDPIGALRMFVLTVWQQAGLDGIFVPMSDAGNDLAMKPVLLRDPAQFGQVNPFKPLMANNAAKLIPQLLNSYPNERFAAILRPCELRAFIEMAKRTPISMDRLVTICIDCLGTFPMDEYYWRAARKGSPEVLTQEALQFARQGGIVAYRYRSACQMCVSPDSHGADLNIDVLGLPVRQHILVKALNEVIAQKHRLGEITQGEAEQALVEQRERMLAKLTERNARVRERVVTSLSDILPSNIDSLIAQLESCTDCQNCLENCPICTADYPKREMDGHYRRADIMRWMASCAGCGMCEQSCPKHLPLSAIFGYIRQQLDEPYEYVPGRSLDEPLPIA